MSSTSAQTHFRNGAANRPQKVKVAAIQMNTQGDPAEARAQATALIREAAANGAKLIVTPEYTNVLRYAEKDALPVCEYDDDNNTDLKHYRALAKELGIWLDLGSLSVKLSEDKMANRQFLINPQGQIAARYDKIHMFDVDLPDGHSYRESDTVVPGTQATVAKTPFGTVGMNICYDLRFPEQQKAQMMEGGATILLLPAAYSMASGRRTWETFLRARAAETGCYIIAPAQCGKYENGRAGCWGRSMIVDPWGLVEARADKATKPGIVYATLDPKKVEKARAAYPVDKQTLAFKFKVQAANGNDAQATPQTAASRLDPPAPALAA